MTQLDFPEDLTKEQLNRLGKLIGLEIRGRTRHAKTETEDALNRSLQAVLKEPSSPLYLPHD